MTTKEAGARATLGLFLQRGGWKASTRSLALWDGEVHERGTTCPDGREAEIRYLVDGVEHQGGPSTIRPRHGQVVVISFGSAPPSGPPPQADAIAVPSLGAVPLERPS